MSTAQGPLRRATAAEAVPGLNYTAINATVSADVVAFPPAGFKAAEYRHRIGSGADRFDAAGRSLMTWGALRAAGFRVDDVRAEPRAARSAQPRFLDDGTPWITPGMTATVVADEPGAPVAPVKVVNVIDEPGRIGYVQGSMPGSPAAVERFLVVEHDHEDDGVYVVLRSIWESPGGRFSPSARLSEARQRRVDERIVRALHPSYAA